MCLWAAALTSFGVERGGRSLWTVAIGHPIKTGPRTGTTKAGIYYVFLTKWIPGMHFSVAPPPIFPSVFEHVSLSPNRWSVASFSLFPYFPHKFGEGREKRGRKSFTRKRSLFLPLLISSSSSSFGAKRPPTAGEEKKRVKQKKLLVFFSDKRQKETCQASGARTQTFPIYRPRFAPLKSVFVRRFRVKENGLAFRYMCTVSLEAISIFFDHLYSACV